MFRNAGRPLQGFVTLERIAQGKPWAMLSWPFGPSPKEVLRNCSCKVGVRWLSERFISPKRRAQ